MSDDDRRDEGASAEPAAPGEPADAAAPAVAAAATDAPVDEPGPGPVAPAGDSDATDADLDPGASGSLTGVEPTLAGRAWRRAQTIGPAVADVTRQVAHALGPTSPYHRHDFLVIALALAVVAGAAVGHRHLITPTVETFRTRGLTLNRPATWLAPEEVPRIAPRLVAAPAPRPRVPGELPYHVVYTSSLDPDVRMEVRIEERPPWSNVIASLELDRRTRWGELYGGDASAVRTIGRHSWLKTSFRYAYAPSKGDEPRIGHATELATVDRERLYAVTVYGRPAQIARLLATIEPSLRVASLTGVPLATLSSRAPAVPDPVRAAFDRTVMVVVADVVDGRLRAVGGGSGAVVGADGSIVTAHHLLVDRERRPHAVFIVARSRGTGRPPEMVCAGHPTASKLWPELDLALAKCDVDLDGRPWRPSQDAAWPAFARRLDPGWSPGQRLWVLGFPDVGGGALSVAQGAVQGVPSSGGGGDNYIRTDATISHGNSGGPVVDDLGQLIGVASAFRVETTVRGTTVQTATTGLIRPISVAGPLFQIVQAGWIPREGRTSIDLEPTAIEAEAEGIRLSTRIVTHASGQPVRGALLMILRAGVAARDIDVNRLDDLVISWGRSGADGQVFLKQPVPAPGTYSVLVTADGHSPLIGDRALTLGPDTPPFFDPWSEVRLDPL